MKTPLELIEAIRTRGPDEGALLIETRDREVRAAALREAAEMVRADRGEIECVTDLLEMAGKLERGE